MSYCGDLSGITEIHMENKPTWQHSQLAEECQFENPSAAGFDEAVLTVPFIVDQITANELETHSESVRWNRHVHR